MRRWSVVPLSVLAAAALPAAANAAAFTPGNVVVERIGTGAAALTNAATAVFLDEYTPAGTLVQSIPLPTAVSGANRRLTDSGTATSDGFLSRSSNGSYLVVPGYDADPGTAGIASTASATVPRVIARVDSAGSIDTTTALTDAYSANNFRSVASVDGSAFWLGGGTGGPRYATFGATTSTSLATTPSNVRNTQIFGGQLFISSSTAPAGVLTVGTGLPTTAGQTASNIAATASPYSYVVLDLSSTEGLGTTGLDTVYVADDAGSIKKFSLSGSTWTARGSVTATAVRGLTGYADPDNGVVLYGTTGGSTGTGGGSIYAVTDASGFGQTMTGTLTTVATASTNTAFRGIALPPVSVTGVRWIRGAAKAAARRGVSVSWTTGTETDNVGFSVVRVRKGAIKRVTLTKRLIPGSALVTGKRSSARRTYRFKDASGRIGDRYFVIDHSLTGNTQTHGPLVARAK